MIFFKCTVGGSGKGNTVTVTCAEEFAGLTITLSKTGKTYTKTCPSTAPYVVTYYGVENGTYAVSCTVDGQTHSETVIVQDISCVLNYGFNWQIWVDTASQLDSSDYDSLYEVLADELAVRELFLEHTCVDYMARVSASNEDLETVINNDLCAKWINLSDYALDYLYANEVIAALMDEADKYFYGEWALMPQVPIMTSNTAPYGTASSNSQYNNDWAAYKAFDGNSDSRAMSVDKELRQNYRLSYDFGKIVHFNGIYFKYLAGGPSQYTYSIQASNDGINYSEIVSHTTDFVPNAAAVTKEQYFEVDRVDCRYIKVILTDGPEYSHRLNVYGLSVYTLQFYAWGPKGNVPVMTSDTAPYGVSSASSVFDSNRQAWNAFSEKTVINGWTTAANASTPWLRYQFINPVNAKKARVEVWKYSTNWTAKFKIQGSNDGTNFVDVSDEISITPNASGTIGEILDVDISTENYYLFYQIKFSTVVITSGTNFFAFKLQFYGRELKVSVPVMTSNTVPYGEVIVDHLNTSIQPAWKAFLNTSPTGSVNNYPMFLNPPNGYLGYLFGKDVKFKLAIANAKNNAGVQGTYTNVYKLQYTSDNGATWDDIPNTEETIIAGAANFSSATERQFNIDVLGNGMRLFETTPSTGANMAIGLLQFYGLDYSEKEFEAGTTKKWLYDHGVELVDFTGTATSNSSYSIDETSLYVEVPNTVSEYASVFNLQAIDTTPYALIRCVVGNRFYSSYASTGAYTYAFYLELWNTVPTQSGSRLGGKAYGWDNGEQDLPRNCCLSASYANEDCYIAITTKNTANSNNKAQRFAGITELWLE